jgi:molybdate transport system substrate-binding protein
MAGLALTALAVAGGLLISVCGGDGSEPAPGSAVVQGEIVVFAASSLTDAFTAAGKGFEQAHPGTKVTFSFAASSALATQINEGAPADVFASADAAQLKAVTDRGNAGEPAVFAQNLPVLVVPKGGTAVQSFADLAQPKVRLVLAGKEVPIGRYAREILQNASGPNGISAAFAAQVLANLKSDEANVRAVLTKVQLGEADAGIVYQTDVAAAHGEVRALEIPQQYNVVARYPIAALTGSKHQATARAFIAYILSEAGQAVLRENGFRSP